MRPKPFLEGFTLLTPLTRAWRAAPVAALALLSLPLTASAQAPPPAAPAPAGSDLSPAQQARMQARQAQFQKELAALRADAKMTTPQKQAKYTTMVQALNQDTLAILTPGQRVEELKRRQINGQFQKDVAALRADKTMTDAQKKARYLALVQAADAQTLATLTASQRALVEKRRQTQTDAMRIAEDLQKSQTPAQAKQIKSISLAARARMQAVMADKSLSDQAKTAKIKEMSSKESDQISALLTPNQRAKFMHWQQLVGANQGR